MGGERQREDDGDTTRLPELSQSPRPPVRFRLLHIVLHRLFLYCFLRVRGVSDGGPGVCVTVFDTG